MAEADLSKIVNLIMENPKLIEQIKNLASQNSENQEQAREAISEGQEEKAANIDEKSVEAGAEAQPRNSNRRRKESIQWFLILKS